MNGWIELGSPGQATIDEALERQASTAGLPSVAEPVGEPEELVNGYIAEIGARSWLKSLGVPFAHDGGYNGAPDLVVAGIGVGVRCCSANGPWAPALHVCNPAAQMAHAERLFVGHEREGDRYLILGGISTLRFRARARLVRAGETDPAFGGRRQKFDVYVYPTDELEPPLDWLERLRRS